MNWENCSSISHDEQIFKPRDSENTQHPTIKEENEQKKVFQLLKYQDPTKDESRKAYIVLSSRFGELLMNTDTGQEEITKTLMTTDCEIFLFNFAEAIPVLYTAKPEEFKDLYKDYQVVKRQIKENCVDIEKKTAFQICYCEIMNKNDKSIIPQFSCEIFSFKDDKISKYRASYGSSKSFDENNHPFLPSKKDRRLAKVKELNYAWAGQPDLERIAVLLSEATEYKIWRWKDRKSFILHKSDFVTCFNSLQESYTLKCVVPYEVYSEGEFIIGTYVYHFEDKNELKGQEFVWLSTCYYAFDKENNIMKINQHGEFYQEDEKRIPFEIYPKEKVYQKMMELYPSADAIRNGEYLLTTNHFTFSFEVIGFAPKNMIGVDHMKGFNQYIQRKPPSDEDSNFKWLKPVDIYHDYHDPSYDIMIVIDCYRTTMISENYKYSGIEMTFYNVKKAYLENGKVAKVVAFYCEVPEMIPSPYDDPDFSGENIQYKENIKTLK